MPYQITTTCTDFLPLSAMYGSECIGDSLEVINNNFENIADNFCNLLSTVTTVSSTLSNRVTSLSAFVKSLSAKDSATIDLTFNANSYILSADVTDNSLGTIKLGQDVTTFAKGLLTSTTLPVSSLTDVQINSILVGQVLKWNGTRWTNQPDATAALSGIGTGNKVDITVGGPSGSDLNNWQINPGVVDSAELANNSVIESKILNGSVTTSKLASATGFEAVVTQTIRDNAVTETKIASNAVTETKIASNAVTETKIASDTVTNAKLKTAPAFSIKCNPTGAVATPQDLVAVDNKVLVRTGGSLQFTDVPNSATTGTRNADSNTLVLRDSSGSFSAAVVEASAVAFGFVGNLRGNALSADNAVRALSANFANEAAKLQIPRTIALSGNIAGSTNFDGSSNINIINTAQPAIITGQTTKSALSSNDEFLIYDATSNSLKKITAEFMKNFIINVPYLEYAWRTIPSAAPQTVPADTLTVLSLNTEVSDDNGIGTLNTSTNIVQVPAGTYRFSGEIISDSYVANAPARRIFGLWNNETLISARNGFYGGGMAGSNDGTFIDKVNGQFTITSTGNLTLRLLPGNQTRIGTANTAYPTSLTSPIDQRITLQLWKIA